MIVFVPVGRDVTLRAELTGDGVESITAATFELFRLNREARQTLDRVQGTVVDRIATCTWTARGPQGDETGCSVYYRVTAGELTCSPSDELVVFHNTLEITARKESGDPQPLALCRLRVTPDPMYTPPRGAAQFPRTRLTRADAQGVVRFTGLPPGRWEAGFESPFHLVRWVRPLGRQREAVVERLIRAEFVWPVPDPQANNIHKQWVNLTEDPSAAVVGHPDRGPVLTIRAKVAADPVTGRGQRGDRIYLRATFGAENSLRDTPACSFEGTAGGRGVGPIDKHKDLAADDGEVEFTLHLGLAGGDSVALALGGTPACSDATLVIQNWRKLRIHPVRPRDYVLPNDVLHPGVQAVMVQHLRPAYIDLDFEPAEVLADNLGATVVAPEVVAHYPNWPQGQALIFYTRAPEKGLFNDRSGDPKFPPRLHLVLGHVIASETVETHMFSLTKMVSDWIPSKEGVRFYAHPFDGRPLLGIMREAEPERPQMREVSQGPNRPTRKEPTGRMLAAVAQLGSNWKVSSTEHGELDDACIEISEDKSRFRVRLPTAARGHVSSRTPARVEMKIRGYSTIGGSSTGNWVSAVWLTETDLKAAVVILHELGHSIDLAPNASGKYGGLPASHDLTYGRGATDDDEHGHEGPHCANGLSKSERATANYSTLVLKGKHGSCIMFGGVGPKTRYDRLAFCDKCRPYLLATPILEL
ncbi:MAG: hypothetical protein U0325_22995 [Polyangiales bacterium]